MTPEEHLRLNNFTQSSIEWQAQFQEKLDRLAERQAKQEILIEEDRAAIRDLIAVSRTLVDSQSSLTSNVNTLNDTVREHQGRIDALIDTVDRILRRDIRPS